MSLSTKMGAMEADMFEPSVDSVGLMLQKLCHILANTFRNAAKHLQMFNYRC